MTQLRKMVLEELERRNYSQSTVRAYVKTIEDLARYFKRPPNQLGPNQLRQYQAYLFRERKLAPNTIIQRTAALRFFFVATLRRPWSIAETPYPRKTFRLPKVLSPEQVARLIEAAPTLFYRILLMTLYATGLRRAELAHRKQSATSTRNAWSFTSKAEGAARTAMSCSAQNCWLNLSATCADFAARRNGITSRWRDSAHHNEKRLMTLHINEFLRRFLLHVLPPGFVRIRHFGFLSTRKRCTLLPLCFRLLAATDVLPPAAPMRSERQPHQRVTWLCPHCHGPMLILERWTASQLRFRSPPSLHSTAA